MDAQQKKGEDWTQEEIKELLRIWKEPDIRDSQYSYSQSKRVLQ